MGDRIDQLFASLRERVRECPTFATLIAAERAQIERSVFDVRLPSSDPFAAE